MYFRESDCDKVNDDNSSDKIGGMHMLMSHACIGLDDMSDDERKERLDLMSKISNFNRHRALQPLIDRINEIWPNGGDLTEWIAEDDERIMKIFLDLTKDIGPFHSNMSTSWGISFVDIENKGERL